MIISDCLPVLVHVLLRHPSFVFRLIGARHAGGSHLLPSLPPPQHYHSVAIWLFMGQSQTRGITWFRLDLANVRLGRPSWVIFPEHIFRSVCFECESPARFSKRGSHISKKIADRILSLTPFRVFPSFKGLRCAHTCDGGRHQRDKNLGSESCSRTISIVRNRRGGHVHMGSGPEHLFACRVAPSVKNRGHFVRRSVVLHLSGPSSSSVLHAPQSSA